MRNRNKKKLEIKRRNMTHLGHIIDTPKAGFHSPKKGERSDRKPLRKRKHKGKGIDC